MVKKMSDKTYLEEDRKEQGIQKVLEVRTQVIATLEC